MTVTLEQRRRELLRSLGLTELPTYGDAEALMQQALVCFRIDKGYPLVSPPKGSNKKWQARTSGKPCGQRSLGQFASEEEAATQVIYWIFGVVPTPPTPNKRNARGEGKRKPQKLDRCNHGKGALFFSNPTLTSC
jgi:hypothetical protein